MNIGVSPVDEFTKHEVLFSALRFTFGVEIEAAHEIEDSRFDAVIIVDAEIQRPSVYKPMFVVAQSKSVQKTTGLFSFEPIPEVPLSLRGARLADPSVTSITRLAPDRSFQILAHCDGQPIWLQAQECPLTMVSALGLPLLMPGEMLYQYLCPGRWAALLPLLHWLKQLTTDTWAYPSLRASIIIDDPNLHACSFGYLSYDTLLSDAKSYNYHVSIATIPIDTWYTNANVAALFRNNTERLSLAVHGNSHTNHELARSQSEEAAQGILRQALRRVGRFEQRSGLRVSRVMVAPHGACNEATARAMLAAQFEAACISVGSLVRCNPATAWMPSLGMWMAYPFAGVPVFHRVGFEDLDLQPRLMAFLGQPIVFRSHHADCRDGLDKFRALAKLVNSFGAVNWLNLGQIGRTNMATRTKSECLEVQMFARRVTISRPPGIKSIIVNIPWIGRWQVDLDKAGGATLSDARGTITIGGGTDITIELLPSPDRIATIPGRPPIPLWPYVRRVLCEARDRAMPFLM